MKTSDQAFFSPPGSLAVSLRKVPALTLLDSMTIDEADIIVTDWLAANASKSKARSTIMHYQKIAAGLLSQVGKKIGHEETHMTSPIEVLKWFFDPAQTMAAETWLHYRSALLYHFVSTRESWIEKGLKHTFYDRAIATLIVVGKPPFTDLRAIRTASRHGIPKNQLSSLYARLEASTVSRSSTALTFLKATLLTGIRPCEWQTIEFIAEDTGQARPASVVVTNGKRKANEVPDYRTIQLLTVAAQDTVLQHVANLRIEDQRASPWARKNVLTNMTTKCSQRLIDECKLLWPRHPARWYTLYDARHQARANFVAAFGLEITAGMMGHSSEVSRKHYAPARKGHGTKLDIAPGPDVIEAASRRPANRREHPSKFRQDAIDGQPGEAEVFRPGE